MMKKRKKKKGSEFTVDYAFEKKREVVRLYSI